MADEVAAEKESLTGNKEGGYGAADDGGESGDAARAKEASGADVSTGTPVKDGSSRFTTKSSQWFWCDICICTWSLLVILLFFVVSLAWMNFAYERVQFELHTECMGENVVQLMASEGIDVERDTIKAAYVVPKAGRTQSDIPYSRARRRGNRPLFCLHKSLTPHTTRLCKLRFPELHRRAYKYTSCSPVTRKQRDFNAKHAAAVHHNVSLLHDSFVLRWICFTTEPREMGRSEPSESF